MRPDEDNEAIGIEQVPDHIIERTKELNEQKAREREESRLDDDGGQ